MLQIHYHSTYSIWHLFQSTHLPMISMYTTAGVDFSTTSAMKLYLYRGLSGLKGEAQWADGRMRSRHLPDIETFLSLALSSFSLSRSAAPHSPKPTETDLSRGKLLFSRPPWPSHHTGGPLSRLVCPSALLWLHITTEDTGLIVLSATQVSPRLGHRVCVLSVESKHLLRGVAAMLHHFCHTGSGVFGQLNNTLYPKVFTGTTLLFVSITTPALVTKTKTLQTKHFLWI